MTVKEMMTAIELKDRKTDRKGAGTIPRTAKT